MPNPIYPLIQRTLNTLLDDSALLRVRRIKQEYRNRLFDTDTHTTLRATAPETEIRYHARGLGDVMMARQFIGAFSEYLQRFGDPELGTVTLVAGGLMPFEPFEAGDRTLFWWYSFGLLDDRPGQFLSESFRPNIAVEPDLMLCGSERIQREARQAGYSTLYFPIGTYGYAPLGLHREGIGYAGSKGHKDEAKVQNLIGPFLGRDDFEWVDDLASIAELNLWYNTKSITFGLTREGQRRWGVVNSRVFESLATATPLLLPEHPTLDEVLGFEYPYQVSEATDVEQMVESLVENRGETREEFAAYSDRIRAEHSYVNRLERLFETLR